MEKSFSLRKLAAGAVVFVALLSLCVFTVFWSVRPYARVSLGKTYYFLVKECEESTSASITEQVYASGGAGYALTFEEREYVVLACYYKETEAKSVQKSLALKGAETRVLKGESVDFEISGATREAADGVASLINAVDENVKILYETANGLERCSLSQQEARIRVRGVVSSLSGLRTQSGGGYEKWNGALMSAERKGRELASGILFAKDVRYLQVQLVAAILNAEYLFT